MKLNLLFPLILILSITHLSAQTLDSSQATVSKNVKEGIMIDATKEETKFQSTDVLVMRSYMNLQTLKSKRIAKSIKIQPELN